MSHDVHQVRSFEHPGVGRKRAKSTPKGRQIDPTAAQEIETLLGDRPRRRDLLIEHLHLIQDMYHQISAAHLAALADEMKLSFAEVFETATFYAHFDVVKEGEPDIAPLTIRRLRFADLRHAGGREVVARFAGQAQGPASVSFALPASAAAIPRRLPKSAIISSITPASKASRLSPSVATPMRICRTMSITTPMLRPAAISC